MDASNNDEDSEWRKLMFSAVSKKRKRGPEISELKRCEDIQECLDEEVDIDAVDENGDTVLHKAVMEGYLKVVEFLRDKRASIDILNKDALTACTLAEKLGKTEIYKYLQQSCRRQIDQSRPQSLSTAVDIHPNQGNISISVTIDQKRNHDSDEDNDRSAKKVCIPLDDTEDRISIDELNDIEQNYVQGGITKSLHGTIYQLKHYMLILQRASKLGYSFRLAKEMEAADKLDDLVFEYKDGDTGSLKHRFVQLKHKAAEKEQVTYSSLSNETGGDFSLLKYFISWLEINKRPEFVESVSKDYIICTNIGFDKERLEEEGIIVESVTDADEFIKVTSSLEGKEPQCHKLKVDADHVLFDILKSASDIHSLAKVLVEHVRQPNALTLGPEILKKYHVSLTNEVVDIGRKRFKDGFVDPAKYANLSTRAKKFHDIFLLHVKKLPGNRNKPDDDIWKELKNFKFNLSKTFGKGEPKELPDDSISDYEVSRFFEEFTIAVHQPNEIELTEIMSKEIAEKFELLNADIPFNYFQTAVLNWFKESGTCGRYLTKINVDKFYAEIRESLSTQVTIGLSLAYKEELKNYNIKFKLGNTNNKLQKFLSLDSASGQLLKLTSSQDTLLFALSVHQTLETMTIYKKDDSYILMKLEKLKLPDVLGHVLLSFRSSRSHSLLIIDCAANSNGLYTHPMWISLLGITKKNPTKKLIIIDQSRNDSSTSDQTIDDIGFKNLDNESRKKLLQKKVRFQGPAEISWGTLLEIRDVNNIGEDDEQDLTQIFDVDTLVRLIRNEPMEIGKEVKELDHHYINRIIIRRGVLKNRIFTEPGLTDLIATDKFSSGRLKTLFGETGLAEPNNEKCIILQYGEEADDFKHLCEKNPSRNIHWLEYQSEALICKQSTGGISKLVTYDYNAVNAEHDDHTPIAVMLNEDELIEPDRHGRVIVISDTAGMGKSTILTKLAQNMKKKEPSLLVIRINLSSPESTPALLEETKQQSFDDNDIEKAVDFLVDKLAKPGLGSHIFKRLIMKVKGRAALLFDGFDEISPTYEKTVSTLLLALAKLEIKNLVVTTRLHTSEALERELKTHSYILRPFSNDDQNEFLIEFWKRGLSSIDKDDTIENRLRDHAQKVIQSLTNSIDDQLGALTGIPLQTKMVAEVYSPVEREMQSKTGNSGGLLDFPRISNQMNLIELYRKFVEKKYDIYCAEKSHSDKSNLGQQSGEMITRLIFDAAHQKLALDALFDERIVILLLGSQKQVENYFHLWQLGHNNGERTGIVTRVIDGKPEFVHRTYAEYFAAKFLFNTLNAVDPEQDLQKFFFADFFIAFRHRTIRAFLNCILSFENIAGQDKRCRWIPREKCYRFETSALHLAAAESNIEIAKFLLNCPDSHTKNPIPRNITKGHDQTEMCGKTGMKDFDNSESTQEFRNERSQSIDFEPKDIDTQDQYDNSPLHEAASKNNLEMAQFLIDAGANINTQNEMGSTPLHAASSVDKLTLAKLLIDNGANIHTQNKSGSTPLHEACRADNFELVKFLIDKGANIHTRDESGMTPLHEVSHTDNLELVKLMIDKGGNIQTQNKYGYTLLHFAALADKLELAKFLIHKNADIHTQDKNGSTPLHCASVAGSAELVKYLIDNGANIDTPSKDGRTPLLDALTSHKWEVAKYLIDKDADIHTPDKNGTTPLHMASWVGNSELAELLIDKGANFCNQDKNGSTPLHYASRAKSAELVKYLINKGASIHTQNENGRTPLHEALASNGNLETAEYLIDKGANIHTPEKNGRTVLHHAIREGSTELAKYLIDKGANIHTHDDTGRTPLHEAASQGNLKISRYLTDKGASIHTRDEKGSTPLHMTASIYGFNLELAELLTDKGANIHIQDKDGSTPLHKAASSRNLEMMKFLVDKGANINTQDEEGRTPLHNASEYSATAQYLMDKGANIITRDKYGSTPLHEALSAGNLKLAKLLIDKGVDLNCQESKGLTPLHVAVIDLCQLNKVPGACYPRPQLRTNPTAIIKLLVKRGADATIRNMEGRTPHDLATLKFNSLSKADALFNIDDWSESDLLDLEG